MDNTQVDMKLMVYCIWGGKSPTIHAGKSKDKKTLLEVHNGIKSHGPHWFRVIN